MSEKRFTPGKPEPDDDEDLDDSDSDAAEAEFRESGNYDDEIADEPDLIDGQSER